MQQDEPTMEELCAGCEIFYDDNCSCHKSRVKEKESFESIAKYGFQCNGCGKRMKTPFNLSFRNLCLNCERRIQKKGN